MYGKIKMYFKKETHLRLVFVWFISGLLCRAVFKANLALGGHC
jgi:hypothetical protein